MKSAERWGGDTEMVTYPPDSTGDTTLTNGGSKGKLSWKDRGGSEAVEKRLGGFGASWGGDVGLTLKEKLRRMKSVPSFSLRIWRSLCKALSSSTLPEGDKQHTPIRRSQGRHRRTLRISGFILEMSVPTRRRRFGVSPPQIPHPKPCRHLLEEFDVPIVQAVVH